MFSGQNSPAIISATTPTGAPRSRTWSRAGSPRSARVRDPLESRIGPRYVPQGHPSEDLAAFRFVRDTKGLVVGLLVPCADADCEICKTHALAFRRGRWWPSEMTVPPEVQWAMDETGVVLGLRAADGDALALALFQDYVNERTVDLRVARRARPQARPRSGGRDA